MGAPEPLSERDLAAVREELAAGKPATVWFTPEAVGVPVGGSAKVVAVDDVAEGEFIQVRPAGSRDTMFCSPGELTRTRPPRRRKAAAEPDTPAEAATGAATPARGASGAASPAKAAGTALPAKPAASSGTTEVAERKPAQRAAQGKPAVAAEVAEPPAARATAEKDRRRAPGGHRPAEVTVTLASSPDGEWTVEVMVGKKRAVRATAVQAADVAKAARSLPGPVTEAIEASLEAARRRQQDRVEQLRAELEAAQRALQELSG